MPPPSAIPEDFPSGPWDYIPYWVPEDATVFKSKARDIFGINASNLGGITNYVTDNPWSPGTMCEYNLRAVCDRVLKLGSLLPDRCAEAAAVELSEINGRDIMRTKARGYPYYLSPDQLDTIKPVSCVPNIFFGVTQHYNICDVQALYERVQTEKTEPVLILSHQRSRL